MGILIKKGTYVPQKRSSANDGNFKEVADAFAQIALGEFIEVSNDDVKSSSLEAGIRNFITLKEGEHVRISRVKELVDGKSKVVALRLIKTTTPQPRKSKDGSQDETANA